MGKHFELEGVTLYGGRQTVHLLNFVYSNYEPYKFNITGLISPPKFPVDVTKSTFLIDDKLQAKVAGICLGPELNTAVKHLFCALAA